LDDARTIGRDHQNSPEANDFAQHFDLRTSHVYLMNKEIHHLRDAIRRFRSLGQHVK
jgi:hypothetical protein